MLKKTLFILIFILSIVTLAQNEGNMWYFGSKVGLDFNYDPPVQIVDNEMTCTGCSNICDSLGQLLFYSNGVHPYDKNQNEMPTYTGIGGTNFYTQSPLIVKKPNSNNLYYLFQLAPHFQSQNLRYSVIDMNLNSGLGDVSDVKGIALVDSVCDKITAVRHGNSRDVWIITHSLIGNKYYAYLLSPEGVDSEPVISEVGIYIDNSEWDYHTDGQLQSSPRGDKIAMATRYNDFQILDFNNLTGEISNPITIPNTEIYPQRGQYGCEFSPSGDLLYISIPHYSPTYSIIYQYDLTSDDIVGTELIISNEDIVWGQMQIAPNNKIYIACGDEDYLSVIHNPNELGIACSLEKEGIELIGSPSDLAHSNRGLPNMINTIHLEFLSSEHESMQEDQVLSVFPNPFENTQFLHFNHELKTQTRISIYDIAGKIIFLNTTFSGVDLNLSDKVLIPGIYFVHVENDGSEKPVVLKLVVQ